MDSTQPDRDRINLPAENPTVGVENPSMPQDRTAHLDWEKNWAGAEKSILAGCWTTRFNTDSRTNPGALIDKGDAGMRLSGGKHLAVTAATAMRLRRWSIKG